MYRLNDEQQRIADTAAAVADRELAPRAAGVDRDAAFPKDSIAALGANGLLGLTVPKAHGGLGQGPRTAAAVIDAVAQRCPSTAMVYLMHLCGVACYAAAPDKTAPLLEAAAAGRHLSTLAFSEKGSRSHFWAPVSRASGSGNGAVSISAQKSFVTSAGHADGYVVSTLSAGATQPLESSIYLVLKDDAGVAVSGAWRGLGLRGNASAPMTLVERVGRRRPRAHGRRQGARHDARRRPAALPGGIGGGRHRHRRSGRAGDDRPRHPRAVRGIEQFARGSADAARADRQDAHRHGSRAGAPRRRPRFAGVAGSGDAVDGARGQGVGHRNGGGGHRTWRCGRAAARPSAGRTASSACSATRGRRS